MFPAIQLSEQGAQGSHWDQAPPVSRNAYRVELKLTISELYLQFSSILTVLYQWICADCLSPLVAVVDPVRLVLPVVSDARIPEPSGRVVNSRHNVQEAPGEPELTVLTSRVRLENGLRD